MKIFPLIAKNKGLTYTQPRFTSTFGTALRRFEGEATLTVRVNTTVLRSSKVSPWADEKTLTVMMVDGSAQTIGDHMNPGFTQGEGPVYEDPTRGAHIFIGIYHPCGGYPKLDLDGVRAQAKSLESSQRLLGVQDV